MLIDWDELENTVEFVSMGNEAVLCRKTGKFFWLTDVEGGIEAWPDDAQRAKISGDPGQEGLPQS